VISRWRCRERRDWGQLKSQKRRSVKKVEKREDSLEEGRELRLWAEVEGASGNKKE
jgi:hypothetical protein